jgi:hypothetical protein
MGETRLYHRRSWRTQERAAVTVRCSIAFVADGVVTGSAALGPGGGVEPADQNDSRMPN